MIAQAALTAHLVDIAENRANMSPEEIRARPETIAEHTVIDEFRITDEKGRAYLHYGGQADFTFPSVQTWRDQAHEFWALLGMERGKIVQRAMPLRLDGKDFKYAAVSGIDRPRIVQVGYRAGSLTELTAGMAPAKLAQSLVTTAGMLRCQVVEPDGHVRMDVTPAGVTAGGRIWDTGLLGELRLVMESGVPFTRFEANRLFVGSPISIENRQHVLLAYFDASRNALMRRAIMYMAGVAGFLLLLGGFLSFHFSRRIATPIQQLAAETAKIGEGRLDRPAGLKIGGEVGVLSGAIDRMVASLNSHIDELRRTTAVKERLESEIKIAAEVQRAMLPAQLPRVPGLEIFANTEQARVVGGDFYDAIELPEGRLGFVVGDASGKGLAAALVAAECLSIVRGIPLASADTGGIAAILDRANGILLKACGSRGLFVTLFCGVYEPEQKAMVFANAGHPPPLLLRAGQSARVLDREGAMPLGTVSDFAAVGRSAQLQAGDVILLYTDGITEAKNPQDDLFGEQRLLEHLQRCGGLSPEQVVERILAAVREFRAGAEPSDDLTMLALRLVE